MRSDIMIDSFFYFFGGSLSALVPTTVTVGTLWAAWWIWRFTISPTLSPHHPKALPYLVPFLGHVRGMTVNAGKLFGYGREYFKNTREIFSLTIMGDEFYIVTSPDDILAIYRDTSNLEFDPIVRDIMSDFGVNPPTLDKMFDHRFDSNKCWMDICHDDFRSQMHPGARLKALEATFLNNIDRCLNWQQTRSSGRAAVLSSTSEVTTISVWKWCGNVLVDSATRAFFGDSLYRLAPNMLEDFFTFDEEGWKLNYKYPKFAARKMYDAKKKGEVTFAEYLALPKEERQDASWIVERMEEGMKDLGITEPEQRGPMLYALYRLVNTNAYRLCFWCLAYLLHDQPLLDTIKSEIRPAFKNDTLDMAFLLENSPHLDSFYEEILRVVNDPIGTRLVTHETTIGGKVLLPGRRILMPYKQLHFDPHVFGSNANEFDARRFLKNKSLKRSPSWRPFGGAATHCPGRFLARREVYMFVAVVLFRFDIRLAPGGNEGKQKFPKLDESIPSGGVLMPVPGDDVVVEVRRAGGIQITAGGGKYQAN